MDDSVFLGLTLSIASKRSCCETLISLMFSDFPSTYLFRAVVAALFATAAISAPLKPSVSPTNFEMFTSSARGFFLV
jgi:hypothetical protein